ncbi:unnamed protein product [Lactuca virosa]|uniref:Uncharacterized protein n=1 Tax=Lactuca virosa TaxID=75947 RepID=A0AAU9N4Q3_9ASTR|nr:unnamed protein product [Lactuca virosa]
MTTASVSQTTVAGVAQHTAVAHHSRYHFCLHRNDELPSSALLKSPTPPDLRPSSTLSLSPLRFYVARSYGVPLKI